MNPLIQDAPSLIRSSQQILLVRVTDAKKVETSPGASAVDRVISDVTLQVERVVKGTVSASPPFEVTLPIEQHVRTVSRVFAVPGVWSPFELSPGARYVVFSSSPSEDPVTVLDQQNTLGVRKADEAEFDVTVAAAAEAEHLTVDALISRVMPRAASVGVLLAEYIASYQSSVLFDDFDSFSAMLELLEAPELGLQPRSVLFESLQVNLADRTGTSKPWRALHSESWCSRQPPACVKIWWNRICRCCSGCRNGRRGSPRGTCSAGPATSGPRSGGRWTAIRTLAQSHR
jgi:hypothetical protein